LNIDSFDVEMKRHITAFLDEICRCNNATQEILDLEIACVWNGGMGKPVLQDFASFREG
jgi:hypothetical protein